MKKIIILLALLISMNIAYSEIISSSRLSYISEAYPDDEKLYSFVCNYEFNNKYKECIAFIIFDKSGSRLILKTENQLGYPDEPMDIIIYPVKGSLISPLTWNNNYDKIDYSRYVDFTIPAGTSTNEIDISSLSASGFAVKTKNKNIIRVKQIIEAELDTLPSQPPEPKIPISPPQPECRLTNAYWSLDGSNAGDLTVNEGTQVKLVVEGANCDSDDIISFTIVESDVEFDDNVDYTKETSEWIDNKAMVTWQAKWQDDSWPSIQWLINLFGGNNDPEFRFRAKTGDKERVSNKLIVKKSTTGGDECQITSLVWWAPIAQGHVIEIDTGNRVQLVAYGNEYCIGEHITFEIKPQGFQGTVTYNEEPRMFAKYGDEGVLAFTFWEETKWESDNIWIWSYDLIDAIKASPFNPSFRFEAKVSDQISMLSPLLTVRKTSSTPAFKSEIQYCQLDSQITTRCKCMRLHKKGPPTYAMYVYDEYDTGYCCQNFVYAKDKSKCPDWGRWDKYNIQCGVRIKPYFESSCKDGDPSDNQCTGAEQNGLGENGMPVGALMPFAFCSANLGWEKSDESPYDFVIFGRGGREGLFSHFEQDYGMWADDGYFAMEAPGMATGHFNPNNRFELYMEGDFLMIPTGINPEYYDDISKLQQACRNAYAECDPDKQICIDQNDIEIVERAALLNSYPYYRNNGCGNGKVTESDVELIRNFLAGRAEVCAGPDYDITYDMDHPASSVSWTSWHSPYPPPTDYRNEPNYEYFLEKNGYVIGGKIKQDTRSEVEVDVHNAQEGMSWREVTIKVTDPDKIKDTSTTSIYKTKCGDNSPVYVKAGVDEPYSLYSSDPPLYIYKEIVAREEVGFDGNVDRVGFRVLVTDGNDLTTLHDFLWSGESVPGSQSQS